MTVSTIPLRIRERGKDNPQYALYIHLDVDQLLLESIHNQSAGLRIVKMSYHKIIVFFLRHEP